METVVPWTMAGVPVAGMPVGFDDRSLPMGIQIIGRHGADLDVLQLAYAFEQATQWVERVLPPALRVN
jgi:amidase